MPGAVFRICERAPAPRRLEVPTGEDHGANFHYRLGGRPRPDGREASRAGGSSRGAPCSSRETSGGSACDVPGAEAALSADLASIEQTQRLAADVNRMGAFDAVIHNAAIGYRESRRVTTVDGLSQIFAINTLAPYILTALIRRPRRLIYLSSGLHRGADASLSDLNWEKRAWNGMRAYADTKLHDAMLARAVARRWSDVLSNAVEPGWVATKMGGPGCARRPRCGAAHPGLARDQRRPGRDRQRSILLSSEAAPGRSSGRRQSTAGSFDRILRAVVRCVVSRLTVDAGQPCPGPGGVQWPT